MNMCLLLSFCFLVCNQINFGMWQDRQDSSLLAFQKEAQQEKKAYINTLYFDPKQLDKHVAKWYKTHHFKKEIANQTMQNASLNFSKQSLEDKQAIITYSNPELQTLLKVLQLSPEMQYPIIQYLFSGRKNELAVDKFYKNTLTNAHENLALTKEYAEKNKNLDFSEWFLLDTPEQYEMTLKLLSQSGSTTSHITPQELAIIRSLPTCIKTHPALNKTYTRDYEWHENIQHVLNPLKNLSLSKDELQISTAVIGACIVMGKITDKTLIGGIAGLPYASGILIAGRTYDPIRDILGKKNTLVLSGVSTTLGLGGIHYLPLSYSNAVKIFMPFGFGIISLLGSFVTRNDPERNLIVTKSLDQI